MKLRGRYFIRFVSLAAGVFFLVSTFLWAQGGSGALTGLVTDPSGAVVPNAKVTLTNTGTGQTSRTVTTSAGVYSFPALPVVGSYNLKVEASGFRAFGVTGIVITVGRVTTQDVHLQVGAASETVTVHAGAQLVQPTESQISALVSPLDWRRLPLETRSQNTFIDLVAGASPDILGQTGRGAAVDGARTGTGNYEVGGFDNNDQGLGGGASSNIGPGGANTTISPDAIEEYRVITHIPPAEYGKTGGFVTDTVLRSGTNSFHGSLFEYNRVQALAANHFFSNRVGNKDSLVRNQFGGSVGGPIIKDRTFFFFTAEFHRLRENSPVTATGTTQQFLDFVKSGAFESFMESDPNGLCMQVNGAACPGAFSSASTLGPIFSKLLGSQPFPLATRNFSNCGESLYTGPFGFIAPSAQCPAGGLIYPVPIYGDVTATDSDKTDQNRYSAKVDHKISSRDQLHALFLYDNIDQLFSTSGSDTTIGVPLPVHSRAMNAGAGWDHVFSPMILNQFRVGYVRHTGDFVGDAKAGAAGLPSIVTAFDPLGVGFGNASNLPQFFTENEFQYKDDLSFVKGKHNFKTGLEYRRTRNGSSFDAEFNGLFLPYGVEDLVTDMTFGDDADQAIFGGPMFGSWFDAEASVNPLTGQRPEYYRGFRANELGAYFQDDWRVAPRFTLNLGLRWDYFGPPHNFRPNIDSNFYFGAPITPIATTSNNPFFPKNSPIYAQVATGSFQVRNHELWAKDTDNWGPRIGFAWDTFGNQKFIVRAGYGIGYDRMYNNIFENIRFNPPFFCFCGFGAFINGVPGGNIETPGVYTVPFTSTSQFVNPAVLPVLPKGSPRHMDQNLETAYYEQFALSTQWAFLNGWMLETDYIRTLGRKLLGILDINTFDGRTVGHGFSSKRPNPNLVSDNFRTNAFKSNYNALQMTVSKNFARGLGLQASYTFSKALDDLSDVFLNRQSLRPMDSANPILDYGPADFDVRHRFVASLYYELPFLKSNRYLGGWAVDTIVVAQSGFPFSVIDSNSDVNKDGHFGDRISYTGSGPITNAILNHGSPADGYFNPSVFADTVCPSTVNQGLWCDSTTGRNVLTGPGFKNVDFGVSKSFKLYERASLVFVANLFNLFNHPNFTLPENNLSSGAFGRSRGTLDPRITQLALRFEF
jgi:hypothetical protein